jgi:hypothetical protein
MGLRVTVHYPFHPWHGRELEVLCTPRDRQESLVVVDPHGGHLWDNTRVAQHRRDRTPGGYTTLAEHMPAQHRWYAEWSPERFRSWARVVGPQTEILIGKILDSRTYAPQAYRSCLGILNLVKRHGALKLEKACAKALQLGSYSCRRLRNILTLRLEEEGRPELDLSPSLPEHENLRGSGYYN